MAENAERGTRLWNLCNDMDNVPTTAAVKLLIDRGANVNTTAGESRYAVLTAATRNRHLDAVKTLNSNRRHRYQRDE
jgi:ankyrin repeat protein